MDIKKRQLAKKRQLLAIKGILDDMNIPFWLHSGVLLGYYRDRDLMEYDPDLDVGVMRIGLPEDFLYKLSKRLSEVQMRIRWNSSTHMKICMDGPDGEEEPHCDIWIHDGLLPGKLTTAIQTQTETIRYEYNIGGFVDAKFLGTTFLIPANTKEILFTQYGPNWKTPIEKFEFDKDPYNIAGKPTLILDETPAREVLKNVDYGNFTAVFGPITIKDADILSKNCKRGVVFSEQPEMKVKNVKFVRCDETHDVSVDLEMQPGTLDCAVIPNPAAYNAHNMRTMLETVWKLLKNGGKLQFFGEPPACVSEFMFDSAGNNVFRKYEMHENWEKNVTAIVTTFESNGILEKSVESIKKHHKDMRIIVVDNSETVKPLDDVLTIALPFDSGLAASRNAGLLYVQTPYVLITDDDQVLLEPNSVKKLYDSAINNGLDIVGGQSISTVTKKTMIYFGKIRQNPSKVVVTNEITKILPDGTEIVDLTLNFFVAKTEILRKVRWRDELKVSEHLDFFIRAKKAGVRVGNLKSAECMHVKNPGTRTKLYKEFRDRTEFFRQKWMRLAGIQFYEGPWGDKYQCGPLAEPGEKKAETQTHKKSGLLPQYVLHRKRRELK